MYIDNLELIKKKEKNNLRVTLRLAVSKFQICGIKCKSKIFKSFLSARKIAKINKNSVFFIKYDEVKF